MARTKIVIMVLFLFISCNNKDTKTQRIYLIGNIDNKVNCRLNLYKKDNNVIGFLSNTDNKQVIRLKGYFKKDFLVLKEYAKPNEVTGILEGNYTVGFYNGFWINPEYTIKVPFAFKTNKN